jgi:hypothetical protein
MSPGRRRERPVSHNFSVSRSAKLLITSQSQPAPPIRQADNICETDNRATCRILGFGDIDFRVTAATPIFLLTRRKRTGRRCPGTCRCARAPPVDRRTYRPMVTHYGAGNALVAKLNVVN